LKQFVGFTIALAVLLSACSTDDEAIEFACGSVEAATAVARPLPLGETLASDATRYKALLAALDAAHEATDALSRRERRVLAERCGAVSDTVLKKLRKQNSQYVAVDLVSAETRISSADTAMAAAAARRLQANEEYPRTSSVACEGLRNAVEANASNARSILSELQSIVRAQRVWFDEHWARFEEDCPLVLELSLDAAVERVGTIVAMEDEKSAQNETIEMFAVLAEMESAWNSISSSDRSVVCSRFRQNGVQTAQEWIRASGYGKPEWAFVFLSQAC